MTYLWSKYRNYAISSAIILISLTISGLKAFNFSLGEKSNNIVGFYHIYVPSGECEEIVKEQVQAIFNSGLEHSVDKIFYATVGNIIAINSTKYYHIHHHGKVGNEVDTLNILYQYCKLPENNHSKVFYFHDKGAFHNVEWNGHFRRGLNCFVLNNHCIEALDHYDTCGWRASPVPYIHYSGNFWWSKCSYVKNLISPLSYFNVTFAKLSNRLINNNANEEETALGLNRYFAEAWIGSYPNISVADCMSPELDHEWVLGYIFPLHKVLPYCPGTYGYGGPCGRASIQQDPRAFWDSFFRFDFFLTNTHIIKITQRSMVWYNQVPKTYIEWMRNITNPKLLIDGEVLRPFGGRPIYLYYNKTLFLFPNMERFIGVGFRLEDIRLVPSAVLERIPVHSGFN